MYVCAHVLLACRTKAAQSLPTWRSHACARVQPTIYMWHSSKVARGTLIGGTPLVHQHQSGAARTRRSGADRAPLGPGLRAVCAPLARRMRRPSGARESS